MAVNFTHASNSTIQTSVATLFSRTELPIAKIAEGAGVSEATARFIIKTMYTREQRKERMSRVYANSKAGELNPMHGKYAQAHPNFKGVVSDGNGYQMVLKPDWYTGRKGSKHVFLHSVIMCQALGLTEVPKGFVIHHIDGDKTNNDIDNLALLTVSGHGKIHALERATTIQ